jgi:hypothetical protein
MTHPLDKHKERLAKLALEEPVVLITTIQAGLAALAVQHNALAIHWLGEIEDATGCDCDDCQKTFRSGINAMRLIESDRTRIEAALDLVMQIKRYSRPDEELIKQALDRSYTEFHRDLLERTVEQGGDQC